GPRLPNAGGRGGDPAPRRSGAGDAGAAVGRWDTDPRRNLGDAFGTGSVSWRSGTERRFDVRLGHKDTELQRLHREITVLSMQPLCLCGRIWVTVMAQSNRSELACV